ncbi:MAG: zinc-binding alcohol dehydrogenase family protein [Tannerellaceae bacterium]|nr:zinc-binding alcohol dehydrogenase family protein [Tannerellaceae bacterium]
MKAIQITEPGKVCLTDISTPALQAGEILVKVIYAGFCGSDLNTYCGKNPMVQLPVIPGHEIGGVIAEIGTDVPDHFRLGMACTVNPYTSCGYCPSCRNGRPNACEHNQTLGVQRNGGMCEYIVIPWQKVITDGTLTPKQFALVEPMSVGFHAVARGQVTDLDYVMVIGCGMIGMGAIIRSALRGANVIAVDIDQEKLQLATTFGACHTINSSSQSIHEALKEITNGKGADVVIEAVGSPETYRLAVSAVAFTGRVVCIGYAKHEILFETKYFVMKEMDIRGSRNAMPEDFRAVMEYLKQTTSPISRLISGIYHPGQAQEALEQWKKEPGKVFRLLITFE